MLKKDCTKEIKPHLNSPLTSSLPLFLIRKFLRFDPAQPFILITAILAFLGVGVGVMVLVVAMAIMEGMIKDFERKLSNMNYPITIHPKEYVIDNHILKDLETSFPNLTFSPFIKTHAALKIRNTLHAGIVYGVDFNKEILTNPIIKDAIQDIEDMDEFDLIVGAKMGNIKGEKALLIFNELRASGLNMSPTIKRFNIKGLFKSGLNLYDSGIMYTNINALYKITGRQYYDGIHVYSLNPKRDIKIIEANYPGIQPLGWWEQNGNFFNAIALEKRALFIVLMLIIIMAALNIISSLTMVIMNRRKEIALLLSLGATKQEISKIFFILGSIIGGSGIILGLILSFILLYILYTFPVISLPADVYGDSKLPLHISFIDISLTTLGAILAVLLSSIYPAKKASNIDSLKVLRNE